MGVGAGLYMCDVVKKSSRSLSHLLMSSCLTKMQKGVINAFLRRMYKYNFVSECFDIDAVMGDMEELF